MAEFGKDLKVTPRAAAKIEDRKRPFTLDVLQQRRDVLANVVIASALPEIFGILVVTAQCERAWSPARHLKINWAGPCRAVVHSKIV